MKSKKTDAIANAVDMLGDKWALMVVHRLLSDDKQCFNELLRSLKTISSRTLSLKLQKLEKDGLLTRKILDQRPIKVQYALTTKGKALKKTLQAFGKWYAGVGKR